MPPASATGLCAALPRRDRRRAPARVFPSAQPVPGREPGAARRGAPGGGRGRRAGAPASALPAGSRSHSPRRDGASSSSTAAPQDLCRRSWRSSGPPTRIPGASEPARRPRAAARLRGVVARGRRRPPRPAAGCSPIASSRWSRTSFTSTTWPSRPRPPPGLGRAWSAAALAIGRDAGARGAFLEVRAGNQAARAFTRPWASRAGLRRGYYVARREDAVLLRRSSFLENGCRVLTSRKMEPGRFGLPKVQHATTQAAVSTKNEGRCRCPRRVPPGETLLENEEYRRLDAQHHEYESRLADPTSKVVSE